MTSQKRRLPELRRIAGHALAEACGAFCVALLLESVGEAGQGLLGALKTTAGRLQDRRRPALLS